MGLLFLALALPQAADTAALPPLTIVARHPDSAARLPMAVSVLTVSGDRVPAGRSLAELLRTIPGLTVLDRGNPSRDDALAVRGTGARASFGVRGVRVFLDGIPQTLPDGQTQLTAIDPAAITRVEVLRGAASAWYGNAAGGAVLISTRPAAPGDAWTRGRMDARVGAHGTTRVGAAVTIGNVTLSAAREAGDGWREHASWETWRAGLSARTDALGGVQTTQVTFTHQPLLEDPGALTAAELAATPRSAAPAFLAADARKSVTHVQGGIGSAWTRGRIDANTAVWGQVRSLRNPLPFVDITLNRTAGGARAAFDISAHDALTVGTGVELQVLRDDRVNRSPDGTVIVRDQIESAAELAPWATARWSALPALDVLASARLDAVRFAATDRLLTDGDASGARTLWAPSVALGASLAIHQALRPWVGAATLFETPTTTELANRPDGGAGFNPDLDPERGLQVEAGVRGAVGATSWEAVAWHARVRDALVPYESPLEPGRILFRNAGRVQRSGLELAVRVAPVPLVAVEGALTLNRFRYQAFTTTAGTFDGNEVPGVPPRLGSARVVVGSARLWVSVDAWARSRLVADDANTARADGALTLGARAGGAFEVAGWDLVGWVAVENLRDARYVGAVQVNANGGRYYEPGAGRAVVVAFSVARSAGGRTRSAY